MNVADGEDVMAYDLDRSNTNSMKWNVAEGELPMWVADMDFETAPAIMEAISKRARHGCFGYTEIPDAWYQAYIDWWKIRHDFTMEKDWLMFCTGDFVNRAEADNTSREGAGADAGVQYIFQFDSE